MRTWNALGRRERRAEIMDQPGLDAARHRDALRGLARINALSRSAGILWPHLAALARERPTRVLDVACGGGDVTLALDRMARQAGMALQFDGCDISPTALELATETAKSSASQSNFFPLDVLREPLPAGYDAVICSLFLHHLDEDEAVGLIEMAAAAAGRLLLINDLARGWPGLALAHVACRVLTHSDVVRFDGPVSVRAAFTPAEAEGLCRRAGLSRSTVRRVWPCRFLIRWARPGVAT